MMKIGMGLTLFLAALDWLAVARGRVRLERLAKPLTMLSLTIALGLATGWQGWVGWFVLGLALSLAGDIFLLLADRFFLAGLVAFLLAHLAYIAGFNTPPPPFSFFTLALAIPLAMLAARIYRDIAAGLSAHGLANLRRPVLAYTLVIAVMTLSALGTLFRLDWRPVAALWVSLGAVLFFISDIILAYNRFVRAWPRARLWNMMAYHLGQMALAWGVWMQWSG